MTNVNPWVVGGVLSAPALITDNLRAMVTKELLPRAVLEVPRANLFHSWEFSGWMYQSMQNQAPAYLATIMAVSNGDGLLYHRSFQLDVEVLEGDIPTLLTIVDDMIETAVREIVAMIHVAGEVCENVACPECYA